MSDQVPASTTSNGKQRTPALGRLAALGVIAATLILSPVVLSGCASSSTDSTKAAAAGNTIKVGILHSLTGTMAISESSLKDVEMMAIDEINKAGGVLGKKIEVVSEDPASDFTGLFPDKAKKLLLQDKVAAVFGCWTSVSRKNVLPVFEENKGLLFYPVQYEGNECSPNVVYTGAAPNQQILPAIDWLLTKEGGEKKKFYLIGSDYVFPRTANLIVVKYLETKGIKVLAEKYTPLGHKDYATYVQDIKTANPDVIFSTINGDSNINFYKELAAQGITADKCPVVAVSVGEDELRGLSSVAEFKGHLAAWNYFQSVDTPENKKFVEKFKDKFGKDRVTDDPIEAAYIGVYFWKAAVEKAKSTDVAAVLKAIHDPAAPITFDAPSGKVKLDPKTQHTFKPFMMGKIKEDKQFEIVYKTPIIAPDPYPEVAFPGKTCDWTKSK